MAVELSRPDASLSAEKTFTENVSPEGARVVTKQRWQAGDRALVKCLEGDFRSQARVVYCEVLPNTAFAIGLKLLTPTGRWKSAINNRATRGSERGPNHGPKFQPPCIRFPWVLRSLPQKRRLTRPNAPHS